VQHSALMAAKTTKKLENHPGSHLQSKGQSTLH